MGRRGKQVAEFPGAALTARVTGLALRWGKEPSAIWARYKRRRKDYELLFAYMEWEFEEQEKSMEEAMRKAKKKR